MENIELNTPIHGHVEAVDHAGKGIIRNGPHVVFIDHPVITGEDIIYNVYQKRRGIFHAKLEEILNPSPLRQKPRCPHFDACGGCNLQILSYEKQIDHKYENIAHLFKGENIARPLYAKDPWNYRNKIEVTIGSHSDTLLYSGFYGRNREKEGRNIFRSKLLDIDECHIEHKSMRDLIEKSIYFLNENPIRHIWKEHMEDMSLIIRQNEDGTESHISLNTRNIYKDINIIKELVSLWAKNVKKIRGASGVHWIYREYRKKPQYPYINLEGERILFDTIKNDNNDNIYIPFSPTAFSQINPEQTSVLYHRVCNYVDPKKDDHILELYSGTGIMGMMLAHRVKFVTMVEINPESEELFDIAKEKNNIDNIRFYHDTATKGYNRYIQEDGIPDTIIVDPPRSGLEPKLVASLQKYPPQKLIYISCNPITAKRDIKLLDDIYNVEIIQPIDLFPQTRHIEIIIKLTIKENKKQV